MEWEADTIWIKYIFSVVPKEGGWGGVQEKAREGEETRDHESVAWGSWVNTGVWSFIWGTRLDAVLRDPNRTSMFVTDRRCVVLRRVLSQRKYRFTVAFSVLSACVCDRVKHKGR